MIHQFHHQRSTFSYRLLSAIIAFTFIFSVIAPPAPVYAQLFPQGLAGLPLPGTMVPMTPGFTPPMVTGITIHPENPLEFDFIIGTGDDRLQGPAFEKESTKLIKYFLAALTVPEEEMWVNLSPYEKDRIIPTGFGDTEMGRDLLAQDYILKQLTASLMYPEEELGDAFWKKVRSKAYEKFGTTEIPMNTFNKVWIVPEEAVVYEHGASAFVVKSHLKVMLEEDYRAMDFHQKSTAQSRASARDVALEQNVGAAHVRPVQDEKIVSGISSEVIREVLIPEIEKEVNTGETFANLRQIYNSVILATWYKQNLKDSLLGQVYVGKNKTAGVDTQDKQVNQKIYDQYLEAFKKGVYNYIREDYDPATNEVIPRKYFSGGTNIGVTEDVIRAIKHSSPISGSDLAAVNQYISSPVDSDIVNWQALEYVKDSGLTPYETINLAEPVQAADDYAYAVAASSVNDASSPISITKEWNFNDLKGSGHQVENILDLYHPYKTKTGEPWKSVAHEVNVRTNEAGKLTLTKDASFTNLPEEEKKFVKKTLRIDFNNKTIRVPGKKEKQLNEPIDFQIRREEILKAKHKKEIYIQVKVTSEMLEYLKQTRGFTVPWKFPGKVSLKFVDKFEKTAASPVSFIEKPKIKVDGIIKEMRIDPNRIDRYTKEIAENLRWLVTVNGKNIGASQAKKIAQIIFHNTRVEQFETERALNAADVQFGETVKNAVLESLDDINGLEKAVHHESRKMLYSHSTVPEKIITDFDSETGKLKLYRAPNGSLNQLSVSPNITNATVFGVATDEKQDPETIMSLSFTVSGTFSDENTFKKNLEKQLEKHGISFTGAVSPSVLEAGQKTAVYKKGIFVKKVSDELTTVDIDVVARLDVPRSATIRQSRIKKGYPADLIPVREATYAGKSDFKDATKLEKPAVIGLFAAGGRTATQQARDALRNYAQHDPNDLNLLLAVGVAADDLKKTYKRDTFRGPWLKEGEIAEVGKVQNIEDLEYLKQFGLEVNDSLLRNIQEMGGEYIDFTLTDQDGAQFKRRLYTVPLRARLDTPSDMKGVWKLFGVKGVIDFSGKLLEKETAKQFHIKEGGAEFVIIGAPTKEKGAYIKKFKKELQKSMEMDDETFNKWWKKEGAAKYVEADQNIIMGINLDQLTDKVKGKVFSITSCTTNAVAPIVEMFIYGWEKAKRAPKSVKKWVLKAISAITAHVPTSKQFHMDKRNRDSADNLSAMIMQASTTGAAGALVKAITDAKGRFTISGARVPGGMDGSVVPYQAIIEEVDGQTITAEDINNLALAYAQSSRYSSSFYFDALEAKKGPYALVSNAQVWSLPWSSIASQSSIKVTPIKIQINGKVKTYDVIEGVTWYPNEGGFVKRINDFTKEVEAKRQAEEAAASPVEASSESVAYTEVADFVYSNLKKYVSSKFLESSQARIMDQIKFVLRSQIQVKFKEFFGKQVNVSFKTENFGPKNNRRVRLTLLINRKKVMSLVLDPREDKYSRKAFYTEGVQWFTQNLNEVEFAHNRKVTRDDKVTKILHQVANSSSPVEREVGGINLNPQLLDLQIKRDGNGVPLPLNLQPIQEMHIDGFVPVIINVTPVVNLPMLLGFAEDGTPVNTAGTEKTSSAFDLSLIDKYRNRIFNRKNSPMLASGLPHEEEFEKPWVSQVQDSSEIPRMLAAGRFIGNPSTRPLGSLRVVRLAEPVVSKRSASNHKYTRQTAGDEWDV